MKAQSVKCLTCKHYKKGVCPIYRLWKGCHYESPQ